MHAVSKRAGNTFQLNISPHSQCLSKEGTEERNGEEKKSKGKTERTLSKRGSNKSDNCSSVLKSADPAMINPTTFGLLSVMK